MPGRPKGTLNLATVLAKTLREKVVIDENGQRRVLTKLEVAVKQLVNEAAAVDLGALRHLVGLVQSAEEQAAQTPPANAPLSENDQKVVMGISRRVENARGGKNEDANENR